MSLRVLDAPPNQTPAESLHANTCLPPRKASSGHAQALRRELLGCLEAPDFDLASRPVESIIGDIYADSRAFLTQQTPSEAAHPSDAASS